MKDVQSDLAFILIILLTLLLLNIFDFSEEALNPT